MRKIKTFFRRMGILAAKDAKVLRRTVPGMLALLALLCAGCVALCFSVMSSAKENQQKLVLGMVDKDGSMISRMILGLATGNQEIAALFQVVSFETAEEACAAVEQGQAAAAMIFEEDYFDKILEGESSAVNVILGQSVQMHAQIIRDFAGTGEILIKTGEYGAGAAWDPMMDAYDDRDTAVRKFDVFCMQFAVELLGLTGKSVDGVVLPYSRSAGSVEGHYMLLYTVLLLTLTDMLFFDFVRRSSNRTLLCRLKSAGVGAVHILSAKLLFVAAVKALLLGAVLGLLHSFFGLRITVPGILGAVCFVLYSSAVGVALCALVQRSDAGPCILCGLGFGGLFLCGGLIPYDMLPQTVTQWGNYTPLGLGAAMLQPLFGGPAAVWPILGSGVLAVALWTWAVAFTDGLRTKGSDPV